MDAYEKEILIQLAGEERTEIAVGLKGEWEEDDNGDYFIVAEWDWDKHGFTPEEVDEIESEIVDAIPKWEQEIMHETEGDWD